MHWCELKRINEAPSRGYALIYTRQNVIFEPYNSLEELRAGIEADRKNEELLEIHLFDNDKEYRSVSSQSSRYPDGLIEAIIDFNADDETVIYKEEVLVEGKEQEKITVLNHIFYNENGMAYIDNYRLQKEELLNG